ncbi:LysR family transcriptional regulator [Burkholderia sp. WAC0059]|uniref:LysR family transcriptional regulator n=1 Tax=Burkholderia sp. WAC0059 TaxID=2066022 RepID=UPI000C7EB741|nr:LysR family transcriptional regulator [Burkholderia sp. WAC0059]PLZ01707.1 LysR family transcriptional regulator [Burkholderia sp. WAC0059]
MKNATFRQIKTFETVARRLSFSRAADELNLSPPAVSVQIKHLEEHAGIALFEQLGKKIYLTSAGQEMLRYSQAIIRCVQEAEESLAKIRSGEGGQLNIGVISAGIYFFPKLVAEFVGQHCGVEPQLIVENRDDLLRRLDENRIDLAVMVGEPTDPRIVSEPFAPHAFLIVAPPRHRLAGRAPITLSELANERFIVRERGSDTWNAFEQCLGGRLDLKDTLEFRSTETIKQAVIAGMGISFVSAHTVEFEVRAGMLSVLDVDDSPWTRPWRIVHRTDKRLEPVAEAFRLFLLEEGAMRISELAQAVAG